MSNDRASSVRLRSSLDFSRCDRRRMPRGGIFDSDSSNNLMFLGSKTTISWVLLREQGSPGSLYKQI